MRVAVVTAGWSKQIPSGVSVGRSDPRPTVARCDASLRMRGVALGIPFSNISFFFLIYPFYKTIRDLYVAKCIYLSFNRAVSDIRVRPTAVACRKFCVGVWLL